MVCLLRWVNKHLCVARRADRRHLLLPCLVRIRTPLPPSSLPYPLLSLACMLSPSPASLFRARPRRDQARPPWPPVRSAAEGRPVLLRRAPKLCLASLYFLAEGIDRGQPKSTAPTPFFPQVPRSTAADSPCSGDLRPCRPRRRSQGELLVLREPFPLRLSRRSAGLLCSLAGAAMAMAGQAGQRGCGPRAL
jgi:hypothetical protein